ncbi:polysaccharide deacetylase family protein [Pseudomonas thivervalensis]|uniref:Polysaccharide deacetylase n=1 Tax=Pseudomonas thivervalensis TaxID=86265 RepID=A0A176NQ01_9PSED|nr:polysaccharide deacetylase family protein [Pseudomonas thivervalensis]AXA53866.1 polysaccharide deacetylase [Pseudomonas thivervalensis]AXA59454.1 polysaccharide deacetylase [Pseudomonas thivervalensis]OAB53173.1 polysaccharide deacetylase [Pseudomonas thivervalensis]SDF59195.1 Polysaccharide deacetylase [Pseudomonas thivervalensis]
MKNIARVLFIAALAIGLSGCIGAPIELTSQTEQRLLEQPPIRFLLTFDDGPSASPFWNPSLAVLDALADNPVQPGIKAVFFLQTRGPRSGGSDVGRSVMRRQQQEGHVLGFHTATYWHTNHRFLSPDELEQSLTNGGNDIAAMTGAAPSLVRPPFWSFDRRTAAAYRQHGLHILLTDMSANDGKVWGITMSPRRRINLIRQLSEVRERIAAGQLPAVDGAIPVVVTFHDINRYTARHAREYLQILLDSAKATGVRTAAKPFYDDRQALERAALARTVDRSAEPVHLPGLWDWVWDSDSH